MANNRKKMQVNLCSLIILLLSLNTSIKSATYLLNPEDLNSLDLVSSFFVDLPTLNVDYDILPADIDDPDNNSSNYSNSNSHNLNISGSRHYAIEFYILHNIKQIGAELKTSGSNFRSIDLPPPSINTLT
jgi:hypothetical protein